MGGFDIVTEVTTGAGGARRAVPADRAVHARPPHRRARARPRDRGAAAGHPGHGPGDHGADQRARLDGLPQGHGLHRARGRRRHRERRPGRAGVRLLGRDDDAGRQGGRRRRRGDRRAADRRRSSCARSACRSSAGARSAITTQLLGEGGSINRPVVCGGLIVNPGDLVLGSDDGVLVLSPAEAERLYDDALDGGDRRRRVPRRPARRQAPLAALRHRRPDRRELPWMTHASRSLRRASTTAPRAGAPSPSSGRRARSPSVVIPSGAIEVYGPHLPLGSDSVVAVAVARRVARELDAVCTPLIPVGYSRDLMSHPGTLTVTPDAFRAYFEGICLSLVHWGFRDLLFLNTHAGNVGPDRPGRARPDRAARRALPADRLVALREPGGRRPDVGRPLGGRARGRARHLGAAGGGARARRPVRGGRRGARGRSVAGRARAVRRVRRPQRVGRHGQAVARLGREGQGDRRPLRRSRSAATRASTSRRRRRR